VCVGGDATCFEEHILLRWGAAWSGELNVTRQPAGGGGGEI